MCTPQVDNLKGSSQYPGQSRFYIHDVSDKLVQSLCGRGVVDTDASIPDEVGAQCSYVRPVHCAQLGKSD